MLDTIGAMIGYGTTPTEIWDMVKASPSIELIRCKDCKHWVHYNDDYYQGDVCEYDNVAVYREADDYCSKAERRNE